ncbi:uncharacterized protein LOC121802920 isoform X1 [Salvia splendens]|uniref:uncharacterized protein LOC121802920 isoform X1 n=1 Tax=Salvia splendens TaxID=180675 RepID=UPI001C2596B9|nr:uncharacterized protein LOC121802920 isoform X1 [Salvia splendens]XP_042058545.1 uncharacterized protein LOC121802920 isoform X1 [Salvia splendens]XP_042058546.1 uncharacterized protein LOC121802920 isoform X1 [Salvia splendens]
MVNSRGDSRLDGLEKATKELNAQFQQTNVRISALGSKLDSLIEEMRAGFAALNHKSRATPEDDASSENRESNSVSAGIKSTSPMPTFDGSEPLTWLARANQYFLINKTSSDRRVDVAMLAIEGPAKPWKQLLVRRCPSLSWDKFVQQLLQRFGDTITSEGCVAGNSSKHSSEGPIATTQVAKNPPKIPPIPNNITATAAAVISRYPSAAMASKNPPHEVPIPKLSVATNGLPSKEHEVSILGETTSVYGLKVPDVLKDPYMRIVSVSAPSSPSLPSPPVLEFSSSSHDSSERQMMHSAKELRFSRSLFGASSHKPANQLVHRPHRQIHIYKLVFEPPPDLHLRI